jgi:dehydrogenase/reductase SDR family protein 12
MKRRKYSARAYVHAAPTAYSIKYLKLFAMASILRTPAFLCTGLKHFTRGGYERAVTRGSGPEDVASMSDVATLKGLTCLVTGANQGLGFQISLELARRQGSVYMCCRNEERGKAALSLVKERSRNDDVHLVLCDVSSVQDIKKFSQEWIAARRPLHILVHNAGVLIHHARRDGQVDRKTSVEGHEINFATNTLGVYALTKYLDPVLKSTGTPERKSRVIVVSSGGAYTSGLEVDDLEGASLSTDGSAYYARDKRRQIALAEYFDERWRECKDNVTMLAMHPGWASTEGVRTSIPGFYETFKDKLRTLEQGADTVVWLSVVPQDRLEGGSFYLDRKVQRKHLPLAFTGYSKDQVTKLVKNLEDLLK